MGRRFSPDNAWGLRVNDSCRNGDTNIDDGKQEFGLMALVGGCPRAKRRDRPLPRPDWLSPWHRLYSEGAFGPPRRLRWRDLALRDATIASRLEYDLSPDLMLYAAAGYHYGASEQDFPSARGMDAAATPDDVGNTLILPSWARVDLGARYRAMLMGKQERCAPASRTCSTRTTGCRAAHF